MRPTIMRRLLLIVFLFSVVNVKAQKNLPDVTTVAKLMDAAMASSDLPAVVAWAGNGRQEVYYSKGPAVWTEQAPVTPQHIFRLASMTKLVTSIAAMQLVEQGKVTLDQDLSSLLPEMAEIPILNNEGKLVAAKTPITLRHLLTHSAGFGYTATDELLSKFDRSQWKYKDLPRRFEAGTGFLYGNSVDWAGKLVSKLSGLTLEQYFRKYIFDPLGMERMWYNVPDSFKEQFVSFGSRGQDGMQPLTENQGRIPANNVTEYNGGGGLNGSPEAYNRLLLCMLNHGSLGKVRILKESTVKQMNENHLGDVIMNIDGAFYYPGGCCKFDGIIKPNSKWGLGYMIDNTPTSYGRQAGTVLWGGAFNTYFFIDYKSGIAVSIYTQHFPFNHPQTTKLLDRFAEIVYTGK